MLALIVAIVAVILLLPSCGGNSSKKAGDVESTTLVKAGDKAPDFTVEMFGGGKTDLAELRGQGRPAELLGHVVSALPAGAGARCRAT